MKNENNTVIDTVLGDITKITGMDAIVNAANSSSLEEEGWMGLSTGRGKGTAA